MNTRNVAQHILFTGAGFTANFGGLLTRDLWGRIFSRVSDDRELRDFLYGQTNFEAAYSDVQSGDYAQATKDRMTNAMLDAFAELDERIKGWSWNPGSAYPVNEYAIRKLIDRFSGSREHASGYFFTLNQDLFVERVYVTDPGKEHLVLPGLENPAQLPLCAPHMRARTLCEGEFLRVPDSPDTNEWERRESGFYYVKLHGSYAWKGHIHPSVMVIGRGKGEAISGSQLLAWYFKTFEAAIMAGGRKILVIGYGFADDHVNSALSRAVETTGLEVSVMTRETVKLVELLKSRTDCQGILRGLRNIYDEPMSSMFPSDQTFTEGNRRLQEEFFGAVIP